MIMPATGFSENDFEALDEWLARRRVGICDISGLEGFLAALVGGPNTVQPMTWLPKVWGGRKPQFRDPEELNRFVALVLGYFNDLALWFEHEPARFRPTFYETKMHRRWSVKTAPAVREIHRYWLPRREAQYRAMSGVRVH